MGNKRYLTKKDMVSLCEHIAATGGNYERYIDWCNHHSVPEEKRFTELYYQKWLHQPMRKRMIAEARARMEVNIRELSEFGKKERIEELENDLRRLEMRIVESDTFADHECSECGKAHRAISHGDLAKLLEMKRKITESIAKERGEYNKNEDGARPGSDLDALGSELVKLINTPKPQPRIIDAETPVRGL